MVTDKLIVQGGDIGDIVDLSGRGERRPAIGGCHLEDVERIKAVDSFRAQWSPPTAA